MNENNFFFFFLQSVACAMGFLYTTVIGLYLQLLILFILVILGTTSFVIVELRNRQSVE